MNEHRETAYRAPEKCPCCGKGFSGGHQVPGAPMKVGLRVFYQCGASMSVKEEHRSGYMILFKNCPDIEDSQGE